MTNSLLRFVKFKEVANWSPHYLINVDMEFLKRFPLVKISMFLKKNKTQTEIKDNESYRRVTIRMNNNGVLLRDTVDGKQIGTKRQFVIKGGQFLVSKIDARNGAFGIAPDSLDGAIVTADFLSFNIDKSLINPLFLELLTSTKQFVDYCQGESSGTTGRQRINESTFLNISVPLPPLNEQSRIVEMFYSKYNKAQKLEEEASRLEGSIETYLQKELGIEIVENKKEKNGLRFVRFAEIERWDNWIFNDGVLSHIYPKVRLQELVVGNPLYGANEKAVKKVADVRYIRITDINEDGTLNEEFVSAQKVENKYLLNEDDFLIARSGNTVGKTFLYKKSHGRCVFAGYLVKYTLNTKLIYPEFLLCFTKSKAFKAWISSNQRIAGQPNINGQEYLNAKIPLPPMTVQKQVASVIEDIRNQIKSMRLEAETLKVGAKDVFTRELFS